MILQMSKPLGGRGKKVPYSSETVRVPNPIRNQVNKLVTSFYEGNQASLLPDLNDAIEQANSILKQKKSARESLSKFLSVLYKTDIQL